MTKGGAALADSEKLTKGATVDFCGELFAVTPDRPVTLGREGDIEIDDNPYLHRRFLQVDWRGELLWLANVGNAISATVADRDGLVQSWLSPGASVPVVFETTVVWFTAGPTTYEFEIVLSAPPFRPTGAARDEGDGSTTIGRVSFTPDQRLLLLVLAEQILRRNNRGGGAIPHSGAAAERLGWTTTKFNRKLDNVCDKLDRTGVPGLVGEGGRAASNRRARLVEYVLSTRLVVVEDLVYLDAAVSGRSGSQTGAGL